MLKKEEREKEDSETKRHKTYWLLWQCYSGKDSHSTWEVVEIEHFLEVVLVLIC